MLDHQIVEQNKIFSALLLLLYAVKDVPGDPHHLA